MSLILKDQRLAVMLDIKIEIIKLNSKSHETRDLRMVAIRYQQFYILINIDIFYKI